MPDHGDAIRARPWTAIGFALYHASERCNMLESSAVVSHLLAGLPAEVLARNRPHLERVRMETGQVVYAAGERLDAVYFPLDCIISLLYTMENGATADMAMVGNEGVVGIALFMGGESMPSRAVVQNAGDALRLPARALQDEFRRGGAFQIALLRYTQSLITQMSQTAVCNCLHSIDQRLCRWLLLSHDRLHSDQIVMTQEMIAGMLGVRREGVTIAAGRLQVAGLIRYARGRITIIDRPGLEARVCECYGVVRRECARLLG
jgi:CRP-like cAMP-binding protein